MATPRRDIRKARINAKFWRDSGSAMAVGGGSVALTLMIAGLAVQEEAYVALVLLLAVIMLASILFEARALSALQVKYGYGYVLQIVIPACYFVYLGVDAARGHE